MFDQTLWWKKNNIYNIYRKRAPFHAAHNPTNTTTCVLQGVSAVNPLSFKRLWFDSHGNHCAEVLLRKLGRTGGKLLDPCLPLYLPPKRTIDKHRKSYVKNHINQNDSDRNVFCVKSPSETCSFGLLHRVLFPKGFAHFCCVDTVITSRTILKLFAPSCWLLSSKIIPSLPITCTTLSCPNTLGAKIHAMAATCLENPSVAVLLRFETCRIESRKVDGQTVLRLMWNSWPSEIIAIYIQTICRRKNAYVEIRTNGI